VVEEAAVFVVVEDEQCVGPDLGVGRQRVEDVLDEVLAPTGAPWTNVTMSGVHDVSVGAALVTM
jgi:hypothetical protein